MFFSPFIFDSTALRTYLLNLTWIQKKPYEGTAICKHHNGGTYYPEDRASALNTHAREFSNAAREQITRKLSEACGPDVL